MTAFDEAAVQLAAMLQGMSAMLEPVQEASVGYREEMKRRGFNEEAANQMAVHYHEVLMTVLKNYAFGSKQ